MKQTKPTCSEHTLAEELRHQIEGAFFEPSKDTVTLYYATQGVLKRMSPVIEFGPTWVRGRDLRVEGGNEPTVNGKIVTVNLDRVTRAWIVTGEAMPQ